MVLETRSVSLVAFPRRHNSETAELQNWLLGFYFQGHLLVDGSN